MSLEERLLAMEERLAALETENAELKKAATVKEEQREELEPMQLIRIKELARDTMKYGYDAAMRLHGRKTAKELSRRGPQAA
ncbi:MAG: hypothetical protein AB9919_02145 [Geobacteraceae bacterium]